MMQHVEEAGVHSGDSACVLPPMSLGEEMLDEIRETTARIALELGVIGLINVQYAVAGGKLYVIEANPRASRTVPFVSKAVGVPLAKIACRLMLGRGSRRPGAAPGDAARARQRQGGRAALRALRRRRRRARAGDAEHRRGDGDRRDFPTAFGKAQAAAGVALPSEGAVFISVTDTDKPAATQIAARFHDLGFKVIATSGTAQAISAWGSPCARSTRSAKARRTSSTASATAR